MKWSWLHSVPILCYHGISPLDGISPDHFISHLRFLREKGYRCLNSGQLIGFMRHGMQLPPKPVVITFDDCYFNNWYYAVPLLKEYDCCAIFFAITNRIAQGRERPNCRDDTAAAAVLVPDSAAHQAALRDGDCSGFMNSGELYATVHDYGHEVFSHTCSHQMCFSGHEIIGYYPDAAHWGIFGIYPHIKDGWPVFRHASAYARNGFWPHGRGPDFKWVERSEAERYRFCLAEFSESKKFLERLLERPVDLLCWPWGEYDRLSHQAARQAGYRGAFTLDRGPNGRGGDLFQLKRIGITGKSSLKWLNLKLKLYSRRVTATIFQKKFTSR
jgi:peptidoglycan/xylan/chitin deacetylase (PgdA/CDA1 family)